MITLRSITFISVISLFLASNSLFAQDRIQAASYKDVVDWERAVEPYVNTPDDSLENAVIIHDKNYYEFIPSSYKEIKGYYTRHVRGKVNNEAGIELLNKISIPVNDEIKIIRVRARSIAPDGEITEIPRENIKRLYDVEKYGNFIIISIDGIQVNSEVEYIYNLTYPISNASVFEVEEEVPTKEFLYKLKAPASLGYSFKSYNGLPLVFTYKNGDMNEYVLEAFNIQPVKEEPYSFPRAAKKRIEYSIVTAGNNAVLSWDAIASGVNSVLSDYSSRDIERAKKYYDNVMAPYKQKVSRLELVRIFEEHVKNEFQIVDNSDKKYTKIKDILKNKTANEIGITKFYNIILDFTSAQHSILVTTDKTKKQFDKNLPTFTNVQDFLFYFPNDQVYLSPLNKAYRLGYAPSQFENNDALLIDKKTKAHYFHKIAGSLSRENLSDARYQVDLTDNFSAPTITKQESWNGHRGFLIRAGYHFSGEEDKKDFIEANIEGGIEGIRTLSFEVLNENPDSSNYNNAPFIINSVVDIEGLIEKAGPNYIFKIGQVIGSQVEMYSDSARTLPIDFSYPISYLRQIEVSIPEGYEIKGVEDLAIKHEMVGKRGDAVALFESTYTQEGNMLTIQIEEFYKKDTYPIDRLGEFRNVINSAADFNKRSIIFSPVNQ